MKKTAVSDPKAKSPDAGSSVSAGLPTSLSHPHSRSSDWIGSMKDSIEILGDIIAPASAESDWEALW
jgi:hypothetical protein